MSDLIDIMNITNIEDFYYELLYDKVSKNIFTTVLPNTYDKSWTEAIVIDIANGITDLNALGIGTVLIFLYVPTNQTTGRKNAKKMNELEIALNKAIDENKSLHYSITRRGTYSDYDATKGMHFNVVEIITKII